MELVFIFPIVLMKMFFIDLFEVMKIESALRIYAFMQNEKLPMFLRSQGMAAVRASERQRLCIAILFQQEAGVTYLAQELSLGTIILVKIVNWSTTSGTGSSFRDITGRTPANGFDGLAVAETVVFEKIVPIPVLFWITDERKLINSVFLILRGMRIIKRPLL